MSENENILMGREAYCRIAKENAVNLLSYKDYKYWQENPKQETKSLTEGLPKVHDK